MKKVIFGLMLLAVSLNSMVPPVQADQPGNQFYSTYEVLSGTSGAAATLNVGDEYASTALWWEVCNKSSTYTDTLSAKINGGDAIVINGTWCFDSEDFKIPATSIIITAVSGTPDYQVVVSMD